jgi:hypothetical protein
MDGVTRCLHCGKAPTSSDGRTELSCIWCDKVDPMQTEEANGPIVLSPSRLIFRELLERQLSAL